MEQPVAPFYAEAQIIIKIIFCCYNFCVLCNLHFFVNWVSFWYFIFIRILKWLFSIKYFMRCFSILRSCIFYIHAILINISEFSAGKIDLFKFCDVWNAGWIQSTGVRPIKLRNTCATSSGMWCAWNIAWCVAIAVNIARLICNQNWKPENTCSMT